LAFNPTFKFSTSVQEMTSVDSQKFTEAQTIEQQYEPRYMEQVKLFFNRASQNNDVPQDVLKYIFECDHVLRFQIPFKRDNGSIETVTCYRAQHKHHFMPTKGGIRFAPDITLQETVALATNKTLQFMLGNIPFGGAFGGIRFDPTKFS